MPDLADLHNTLAAKRQERNEALAKAEAELEAKRQARAADFLMAEIAKEEALIESLGGSTPAPAPPARPTPPAPPAVTEDVN